MSAWWGRRGKEIWQEIRTADDAYSMIMQTELGAQDQRLVACAIMDCWKIGKIKELEDKFKFRNLGGIEDDGYF